MDEAREVQQISEQRNRACRILKRDTEGIEKMNKVILMGRLTRDPNVRYTAGDNPMGIARYTLAVDRRIKERAKQQQTLLVALPSERRQNLQRDTSVRVSAL